MKKVVAYLYIGDEELAVRDYRRAQKQDDIRRALDRLGEENVSVYLDEAPAGATRPRLAELLRSASEGRVSIFVACDISELGSDFSERLNVLQTLARQRVRVILTRNRIDTGADGLE
ncbi:MAG: recombinase family protein [Oscillospiraceae bacterium]